jgi:hypothetical protein
LALFVRIIRCCHKVLSCWTAPTVLHQAEIFASA